MLTTVIDDLSTLMIIYSSIYYYTCYVIYIIILMINNSLIYYYTCYVIYISILIKLKMAVGIIIKFMTSIVE